MSKQKDIREEIVDWFLMRDPSKDRAWAEWETKVLFIKLDRTGVVIKVNREYPVWSYELGGERLQGYLEGRAALLEDDYVAWEPLI